MRTLLVVLGATLVLLLTGLAWAEWRGWPWLRMPLARVLSEQLHRPVSLAEPFAIRLWGGLRLEAGEVRVAQPDWLAREKGVPLKDAVPAGTMVLARDLVLVVPYATLWQAWRGAPTRALRVTELSAEHLDVVLVRLKDGRANWALAADGRPGPERDRGAAPTGSAGLPSVDRLTVHGGRLQLDDAVMDLGLGVSMSTDEGSASLGAGPASSGGLRVEGRGRYRGQPVEVGLRATGVLPLLSEGRASVAVPVRIRAETGGASLSFDGVSHDVLSLRELDGQLSVKGRSLAAVGDALGVTLPTTARFDLAGRLRKQGERWSLDVSRLQVGRSELNGRFAFDRARAVPALEGTLLGKRLLLADLAPAIGVPTEAPAKPRRRGDPVLPQRAFDIPSLRAMDAQVSVDLTSVELGALFATPLAPLRGKLTLRGGVLRLEDLLAQAAGGRVQGGVTLDGRQDALKWVADLRWQGIDLARWLSQPGGSSGKGRQGRPSGQGEGGLVAAPALRGLLAGRASVRGAGRSTAALLGSLEGEGALWVQGGQVSRLLIEAMSLHVAEALGLVVTGDEVLPMTCAAMRFKAHEGVLRPDVALVDTPAATLLASGAVSLAKERLALRIDSRPRRASVLSLRTPVDVGGTFGDPAVTLHPDPLGWKVLAAAALGAVAPLAALLPLIDPAQPADGRCREALQRLGPASVPARR